ncbi:MAG: ATP-grasp domain-containing protein, partial [Rickettsiales bacterium]|nr:ATP-grasp domain-containing protein [Rickettsiales bacterium]
YVHPGYGFLSENSKFAAELEEEDIIFIAPPVEAIHKMGDKIESKKIAKKVGVDVVPGYDGVIKNSNEAVKIAAKIGLPIMIKASAGGGGKGMRMVDKIEDVAEAFEAATNEAINSYGDGRVFMEKFIQNPRHIEIQVIGDKFGNIVCLGERECSIQRNNQKIVEEAPSSFMDEKTRKKMYGQAIDLCREVGYYSAGTVECMMDKDKNFYFLEMNTRLQVEHGVTELITGLDIVELMIRVAKGEKLPFTQKDIKLNGWAMESRICSEDPSRGFLPSSGRINKYVEPTRIDNVRVDTGVYEGCTISAFYDSMICKLLTYGKDRQECLEKMQSALGSFYINGIAHNIGFLETIMYNERFQKGDISTNFIKQEFSTGFGNSELVIGKKNVLISVALYMFTNYHRRVKNISGGIRSHGEKMDNRWVVDIDGRKFLCNVDYNSEKEQYNVEYGTGYGVLETAWQYGDKVFRGTVNNNLVNVKILSDDYAGNYVFQYMGSTIKVTVRTTRISELEQFMPIIEKEKAPKDLRSPIVGKIIRIKVEEGTAVTVGAELCSIEAMKMENIIRSDYDLKIKKILKTQGELVNSGDVIMEFE